jgi:hypothetical protein
MQFQMLFAGGMRKSLHKKLSQVTQKALSRLQEKVFIMHALICATTTGLKLNWIAVEE